MKKNVFLRIFAIAFMSIFVSISVGCGFDFEQLVCEHKYGKVSIIETPNCSKKGKGEKVCELC